MFKVVVFVPESHLETVKNALFDAGAGTIGDYDRCSWQSLGVGQFRPLSGSNPHTGRQGDIETLAEYRLETVCRDECIRQVITSMKRAHPYEEPAFDVFKFAEY